MLRNDQKVIKKWPKRSNFERNYAVDLKNGSFFGYIFRPLEMPPETRKRARVSPHFETPMRHSSGRVTQVGGQCSAFPCLRRAFPMVQNVSEKSAILTVLIIFWPFSDHLLAVAVVFPRAFLTLVIFDRFSTIFNYFWHSIQRIFMAQEGFPMVQNWSKMPKNVEKWSKSDQKMAKTIKFRAHSRSRSQK